MPQTYTCIGDISKRISESGYKIGFLAESIGISRQGFYDKINGKTSFRKSEVYTLSHLLHISEEDEQSIFRANQ